MIVRRNRRLLVIVSIVVLVVMAVMVSRRRVDSFDDVTEYEPDSDVGSEPEFEFDEEQPDYSEKVAKTDRRKKMQAQAWGGAAQKQYSRNLKELRRQGDAAYDLVIYGDSITNGLHELRAQVWDPFFRGLRTGIFGVSGTTVPDLAWRLQQGKELVTNAKVMVLFIGTNDLGKFRRDPTDDMRALLRWLRTKLPNTRIVLQALLRRKDLSTAAANRGYQALAREAGVFFSTCGQDLDPNDPALFSDGLHPTPAAYVPFVRCLASQIVSGEAQTQQIPSQAQLTKLSNVEWPLNQQP